ncbi:MAG: sigma 54-interacting transcriptional regulator [Calditrichaceae bacterium]
MDINQIGPDGTAVIDQNDKIIAFNDAAIRITGFTEERVILHDYKMLFRHSKKDSDSIRQALKSGESFSNLSLNLTRADGRQVNVLASITPIKRSTKEIVSVILVFRDTREMARLAEAVQEKTKEIINEKNKLEAIFNSRSEGTFTIDNDWTITSFNRAAEKITGFSRTEAIGKKCWELFCSDQCHNNCHMEATMDGKEISSDRELCICHKDGHRVPVRVNSAPLFNADKECIGGVETFSDISELKNLSNHLKERFSFENLIGRSKSMQKIYALLKNVAQSDTTVLITGESGTGKELVARALHLNSARRLKPFMALNCSAFVESLLESELFGHEKGSFTGATRTRAGHFELANKGTLFLDEIGDLSPAVQVKLLRVLETRQFDRVGGSKPIQMDVRILAATNKSLYEEVQKGRFRDDLYYRLNVINIHMPPLRERMDDLPLLVDHFLRKFSQKFNKQINDISSAAYHTLMNYHWPGNIRELENVLEHAFVMCHEISIQPLHLPDWLLVNNHGGPEHSDIPDKDNLLENAEKSMIQQTLMQFNNNRSKTAKALNIDKSTLWRKMKKYGLLL